MQRQSRRKKRQAEFSLCIAKISLGLGKFRNLSENFVISAKILLCTNFC